MNKLTPKEPLHRHAGDNRVPASAEMTTRFMLRVDQETPKYPYHRAAVLALLLCLTACGTTPPKQYYLLTASAEAGHSGPQKELRVSLGPVTLPEYLDRSQIVTRRGATQLHLADDQRWAEPLKQNFTRVLAEDLSARLGAGQVNLYPAREVGKIDYRVTVDVTRFDADDQGQVMLTAVWTIHDGGRTRIVASQRSDHQLGSGAGYPARQDILAAIAAAQ